MTSTASNSSLAPAKFFASVHQSFVQAAQPVGSSPEIFLSIAGDVVCLRFAGDGLKTVILPALEHLVLSSPSEEPRLTIFLWDSETTGLPLMAPLLSREDYRARGELRGYNDDRVHTAFQVDNGILSVMDVEKRQAVYWARSPGEITSSERAAPLRNIFGWWMKHTGRLFAHAGAVGAAAGGVLLVGPGGSGKSSSAISCLNSPLSYAGDDYCLVTPAPEPWVHSIYSTAKTHTQDVSLFPFLHPSLGNPERMAEEKVIFFLHRDFSERLVREFPLRAILIPRVAQQINTELEAASPAAALKAGAPSSISQMPGTGGEVIERLAAIVRRVPCYYLNLGSDRTRISKVIVALLLNQ